MKAYATIEKGSGKSVAEDRVLLMDRILDSGSDWVQFADDEILVALADGVGGNAGGGEAAQYVLDQLHARLLKMCDVSEDTVKTMLAEINQQLLEFAANSPGMQNMATTLTGLIGMGEEAYAFHIGNTRLFTVQGSYLRQLTIDQTTKEWLRRSGQLEAAQNCESNEITACLGGGNIQLGRAMQVTLINGWRNSRGWVLTSDGIHDYVGEDEIDLLSCDISQIEDMCGHVMMDAVDRGSCDDRSIVVIRKEI